MLFGICSYICVRIPYGLVGIVRGYKIARRRFILRSERMYALYVPFPVNSEHDRSYENPQYGEYPVEACMKFSHLNKIFFSILSRITYRVVYAVYSYVYAHRIEDRR